VQTFLTRTLSVPRQARTITAAAAVAAVLGSPALAQSPAGENFAAASAVAAIVKVPTPWYAPRFVVVGRMRDTIPQYQALPGLAFKAFSFAQADGHYGGIYLWKDLASARAWFTPAWFARVERERGAPAEVRFFEVLAAIDNAPGGTPADPDSSSVAVLSTSPAPAGVDKPGLAQRFQASFGADRQIPGLLRRYFLITDQGRAGHISLWRDRASAQQWFNGDKVGAGADAVVEWFDTPILLPISLPANQPRIPGL
jgi:heme-degrading monooxygenase HmoA